MILSNYHSHTNFCDGHNAPEEFLLSAISKGFRAYGFSSHSPIPFETFWNMSHKELEPYLMEIKRLKEKHGHLLEIYVALEIDYLNETSNPASIYYQEIPLDYRIGSIHFLPQSEDLCEENMASIDGPYEVFEKAVNTFYEGDIRKIVRHYFDSTQKMVETGGFDIVGHLDKIYQNGHLYPGFSMDEEWYQKPLKESLDLIAQKELMVEINTKNFTKKGQYFPHIQFIPLLKKMRIPVLINSDCHSPELVNDGRIEAFDILRSVGFKSTRELINGQWEDIGIE